MTNMDQQQRDLLYAVEAGARGALHHITDYLDQPAPEGATTAERALKAQLSLKLLSSYTRIRATRANEAAITLGMARMMGMNGEDLKSLWRDLTGKDASAQVVAADGSPLADQSPQGDDAKEDGGEAQPGAPNQRTARNANAKAAQRKK